MHVRQEGGQEEKWGTKIKVTRQQSDGKSLVLPMTARVDKIQAAVHTMVFNVTPIQP